MICFVAFTFLNIHAKAQAPCDAVAGELFGSGFFCDSDQVNIGIPETQADQTYTWLKGKTKVHGPVTGNGSGVSYNPQMSKDVEGTYSVLTEKNGCNSATFGNVVIGTINPPPVTIVALSKDSVSFKWNKVQGSLGYEYVVNTTAADPASGTSTSDTTATVKSLTEFTNYYIHLKGHSSFGGSCAWLSYKFKTLADTSAGTLDRNFNKSGKIIIAAGNTARAYSIAVQKDGKIIAAGVSQNANADILVLRYTTDGKPDKTFGAKGKIVIDLGGDEYVNAITLQSDGKILIAGKVSSLNGGDFLVMRLKTNGTPDSTFGTNGITKTDVANNADEAKAIGILSTGRIVVAGSASNGSQSSFGLIRLTDKGIIDNGFGTNGKVVTDFGGDEIANSLVVQTDDKIIVSGYTGDIASHDFLTIRYRTTGIIDNSFGDNGKALMDFSTNDDFAYGLALQRNGKIIVAGSTKVFGTTSSSIAIVQYKTNGKPDSTFGVNGIITTNIASAISAVDVGQGGKIIVGGYVFNSQDSDVALLRYTLNGQLDTTFGTHGKVATDFGLNNDFAYALKIQKDNKIAIAGYTTNANGKDKVILARYNNDSLTNNPNSSNNILSVQNKNINKILIAPNPVSESFIISGMQPVTQKIISITDVTGKILQTFTTTSQTPTCNVHGLQKGIYYVVIRENGKTATLKFIKE